MLSRLFVVMLTLVGPLPFRVCTCAATPTVCNDPACPAAPAKTCSCGHHHDQAEEDADDAADASRHSDEALTTNHTHPPEHQPGCPTTQVRAANDLTVPAPKPTPHAAEPHGVLLPNAGALFSVHIASQIRTHSPRAPARPLFITLLTLRN
jgi:hypothetical protein